MQSVKNQDKRDTLGINEMLMRIRQKLNSVIFFILKNKWARFLAIRTVGSRRSKKQSRSTQRGLRVDTDLVEFRQLQEVGIFSYLCYSLDKSHVNGWGCSEA